MPVNTQLGNGQPHFLPVGDVNQRARRANKNRQHQIPETFTDDEDIVTKRARLRPLVRIIAPFLIPPVIVVIAAPIIATITLI